MTDETHRKRLWIAIGCNAEIPAQGGLKEKTALWKLDCERSGQSGTNVSVATGITAVILTLLGAISGYAACRVWLLCLCAPTVARRSLRVTLTLWSSRAFLVSGLGLYAHCLISWKGGIVACVVCNKYYTAWLHLAPRTTQAGRVCAEPTHLAAVPAGLQTTAGLLCALALCCISKCGTTVLELEKSWASHAQKGPLEMQQLIPER